MKYIATFLILTFVAFNSYGQLPDGFVAPDFTVTDWEGQTHNLYDILDQDKTVIIDLYATWCDPCWDFHTSHVLADIWEELGPNGTDEVVVFAIETDLSTTDEDMLGTGNSTRGDWITGTPYPIVHEMEGFGGIGQIGFDYNLLAYPTVYFICPDRSVKEVFWQEVADTYQTEINSCPAATGTINGKLLEYIGVEGAICEEQTFAPKITFQNRGSDAILTATFEITINGATEQLNWTGSLNTFSIEEVEFPSVSATNTAITIELIDINGSTDEFPEDNMLETSISFPNTTEIFTVTVEILTDNYGSETYWTITDENEEIVAEGGNLTQSFNDPNPYESNTLYSTDVILGANGCYAFNIFDAYGDGICCDVGDGYYKIISQDNGELLTGGDFEVSFENPFIFNGPVSVSEKTLSRIEIFPNPLEDELTIVLPENIAAVQVVNIVDLQGKTILSTSTFNSSNKINLDISTLRSGLYFVEVIMEDGNLEPQKIFKR